jgi:hypothetical protein
MAHCQRRMGAKAPISEDRFLPYDDVHCLPLGLFVP